MDGIKFDRNKAAKYKYAFIGVPWDQGDVDGIPGSRWAPENVRPILKRIFDNIQEDNQIIDCYDWSIHDVSDMMVTDFGDIKDFKFYDHQGSVFMFADKVREVQEQGFRTLVCGGDCSINFSSAKGVHDANPGKTGIIYMDGHPDVWPDVSHKGPYSHSSPLARINELERVDGYNIIHYGMRGYRGLFATQDYNYMKDNGITMLTYAQSRKQTIEESAQQMIDIATKGTDKVALCIDIDVLEMAFAPGSSANESDGPNSYEICELIRLLAPHVDGISITEVNPLTDVNGQTARRAGRIFLDYIFNNYIGNTGK